MRPDSQTPNPKIVFSRDWFAATSGLMYPRQSPTTHTEQLGNEASVYDGRAARSTPSNPTAARVWRQCDGPRVRRDGGGLARGDGDPRGRGGRGPDAQATRAPRACWSCRRTHARDRPATTRRWLLGRGVAAAMLPAIYSIVASRLPWKRSRPAGRRPTLTSLTPNKECGHDGAGDADGTNFVAGATTVAVNSGGVTASTVIVSSATSLTADIVIAANATTGAQHGDSHDGRAGPAARKLHGHGAAGAGRADADQRLAESRSSGQHGSRSR